MAYPKTTEKHRLELQAIAKEAGEITTKSSERNNLYATKEQRIR